MRPGIAIRLAAWTVAALTLLFVWPLVQLQAAGKGPGALMDAMLGTAPGFVMMGLGVVALGEFSARCIGHANAALRIAAALVGLGLGAAVLFADLQLWQFPFRAAAMLVGGEEAAVPWLALALVAPAVLALLIGWQTLKVCARGLAAQRPRDGNA